METGVGIFAHPRALVRSRAPRTAANEPMRAASGASRIANLLAGFSGAARYPAMATTSISTRASRGSRATSTVDRAGGFEEK